MIGTVMIGTVMTGTAMAGTASASENTEESVEMPELPATVALPPGLRDAAPDDPARLLFELVSIPSVSRDEAAASRFLAERLARFGLDAEVDGAGNAVGRPVESRSGDAFDVLLLGHIDTVPGGPVVELRDGLIYGRGSVDAKGPLAVFAAVAARLARQPQPGLRVTVVGAVEEEVEGSKGARHVLESCPRPDACVIGEPSGTVAVTLGYKGRLLVDLERRRPNSHSAGPEKSATEEVVDAWRQALQLAEELNDDRSGIFDRLQTELTSIQTEHGAGDVDSCRATFGFRLPPWLTPSELEARLSERWRTSLEGEFDLRWRGAETAWLGERRSPLVHAFTGAIRELAGERPRLKHKTGTSDMCVVGPVWQCPVVAYGPGDSRLDHTPNEHVSVEEVRLAADVLEAALRRLPGGLAAHP